LSCADIDRPELTRMEDGEKYAAGSRPKPIHAAGRWIVGAIMGQATAMVVMAIPILAQVPVSPRFILACGVGTTVFAVCAPWSLLYRCAELQRELRRFVHQLDRHHEGRREETIRGLARPGDDEVSRLSRSIVRVIEDSHEERTRRRLLHRRMDDHVERETRRATSQLRRDVETDPLTGLGNRRALDSALESMFDARGVCLSRLAVLALDMDHFKGVNDSLGHDVGDACLMFLGEILLSSLRPGDVAIRLGGDEFLVVLQDQDADAAQRLAERLVSLFGQMPWSTTDVARPSLSIGLATAHAGDRVTGEQLLRRADEALYRSKRNGRSRVTRAA
jgi:diguanylate cyclase (GGDEF)-like protein